MGPWGPLGPWEQRTASLRTVVLPVSSPHSFLTVALAAPKTFSLFNLTPHFPIYSRGPEERERDAIEKVDRWVIEDRLEK